MLFFQIISIKNTWHWNIVQVHYSPSNDSKYIVIIAISVQTSLQTFYYHISYHVFFLLKSCVLLRICFHFNQSNFIYLYISNEFWIGMQFLPISILTFSWYFNIYIVVLNRKLFIIYINYKHSFSILKCISYISSFLNKLLTFF